MCVYDTLILIMLIVTEACIVNVCYSYKTWYKKEDKIKIENYGI